MSIINAVLTYRIRKVQADARNKAEKEKTIALYNTVLNSLSHELRTPLATIIACADTLNYEPSNLTKEQHSTLLNQIQIASARLNEQVENLLNMSRLDSGIIQVKPNWCDINEVVMHTITYFIHNNSKVIEYVEDASMPIVLVDDGLLLQILSNLVGNAIVHTYNSATITITVHIEAEKKLIIQIKDTGIGLPSSELPKLFDKFYRVPNSAKAGTGLGLSIVQGYVTALGGTILVKHNVPQGLIFVVTIPIAVSYINTLKNE